MLRLDVLLILLGMLIVTYIPRMLPALLAERLQFGGRVEKFLKLIPYTAMAALIFPGVLSADPAHAWVGVVGVSVAGVLAYFRCPMIASTLAAIGTNLLIYMII